MTPFPLKIVTPYGVAFDGQAEELVVRTITGGGTDDQFFRLSVKDQSVGGDDLQLEGGHAFSPPRNLATTSSMEPENRK